jgi:hypothetical protein
MFGGVSEWLNGRKKKQKNRHFSLAFEGPNEYTNGYQSKVGR